MKGFRLLGVPVRLHFTFLILLIFLLVTVFGSHQSGANYALFLLGLFASVLMHEMAHAVVATRFGVRTTEIVMFPIGGLSRMERILRPTEELWIAMAGPVMNLLIAAGLLGYLYYSHQAMPRGLSDLLHPTDLGALPLLAGGNLLLALFNLLPAFPMDGGRALRAVLRLCPAGRGSHADRAWMGRMLAISMGLYGLVGQDFLLVFFAFFIYLGAAQEGAAALGRTLTHGIPVRAAMITEFHTLGHGNTVRDAANLLLSTSQQDFPVIHGDQVVGLAGPQSADEGAGCGGSRRLCRRRDGSRISATGASSDLSEVLPLMAQAGRCALVMDGANLRAC